MCSYWAIAHSWASNSDRRGARDHAPRERQRLHVVHEHEVGAGAREPLRGGPVERRAPVGRVAAAGEQPRREQRAAGLAREPGGRLHREVHELDRVPGRREPGGHHLVTLAQEADLAIHAGVAPEVAEGDDEDRRLKRPRSASA